MFELRGAVLSVLLAAACVHTDERPKPEPSAVAPAECKDAATCEASCGAGHASGCYHLADDVLGGVGVPRDTDRALTLYARACELGDGRGCARRGLLALSPGQGLDEAGAKPWLERSVAPLDVQCKAFDAEACELLTNLWLDHRAAAPTPTSALEMGARAVQAFDDRCGASDAEACLRVAVLLFEGKVASKDATRALARGLRACDLGLAGGCAVVGLHYLRGDDLEQNPKRGQELMRRAKVLSGPPQTADAGP